MRQTLVLTVCLAAWFLSGCSGGGLAPGDKRVGQFNGAFTGCRSSPGEATINIWKEGYAYIDTSLEGYIESGSDPERLSGGGRDVRFDYSRNELGTLTNYSVDGMLSEDGQVISGTFTVSSDSIEPSQCQFSVRRVSWDPLYVSTTPGNFSCVEPNYHRDTPLNGSAGGGLKPSPSAPRPSCFTGNVHAVRMRPVVSGYFSLYAHTSGGYDSRPVAVWSACDGRELSCSTGGFGGWRATQFQDVLVLTDGDSVALDVNYEN
jgi:hypothetical protein